MAETTHASRRAQLTAERERVDGRAPGARRRPQLLRRRLRRLRSGHRRTGRGRRAGRLAARDAARDRRRARQARGRHLRAVRVVWRRHRRRPGSRRCRRPGCAWRARPSAADARRSVHVDSVTVIFFVGADRRDHPARDQPRRRRVLLGDDTAKRAGRLTLNPVPHVDPFGSIVLPVLGALDARAGHRMGQAGAGEPVAAARRPPGHAVRVARGSRHELRARRSSPRSSPGRSSTANGAIFIVIGDLPLRVLVPLLFAEVNLFLGVFNFLPIPPLDGAALIERVLPARVAAELVPVPAVRDPRAVPARVQRPTSRAAVPAVPRSPLPVRPAMTRAGHLVRRFAASLRPAPARRRRPRARAGARCSRRSSSAGSGSGARIGPSRSRPAARAVGRSGPTPTRGGSRRRCCTTSARPDTAFGRRPAGALATVAAALAGPRRARALAGRIGRYVRPRRAGRRAAPDGRGPPGSCRWAAAHHRRGTVAGSGIPAEICEILAAADGEPSPG